MATLTIHNNPPMQIEISSIITLLKNKSYYFRECNRFHFEIRVYNSFAPESERLYTFGLKINKAEHLYLALSIPRDTTGIWPILPW